MLRSLFGVLVLGATLCVGAAEAQALGYNYRGPFKGRVVDAETGEPIQGAVVFVQWTIHPFMSEWTTFFDAAEVRTDARGHFSIPKNWSWNPWRNMVMNSVVVILKAGYVYVDTPWWPIFQAVAIWESLPPTERQQPGAWCGRVTGSTKIILQCPDPDFPHGYPIHIEDGQPVFRLKKTLLGGTQNIDTGVMPDHKRRLLLEEIRKDSLLRDHAEGKSDAIGRGGRLEEIPFPKDHQAP